MPFPFADTRFLDWHSQGCPPRNREVKKGQRLLPGGSRTIASSSRSVGPTVGRACSCRSLERAEAIDPQPHPRFLPNFPRPVKRRKGKAASCGERGPRDKRRGGLFPLYEGKGKKSCIWRDRLDDAIIEKKKRLESRVGTTGESRGWGKLRDPDNADHVLSPRLLPTPRGGILAGIWARTAAVVAGTTVSGVTGSRFAAVGDVPGSVRFLWLRRDAFAARSLLLPPRTDKKAT